MEYSPALAAGLSHLSDALDDPISDLQAVLSVLSDDLTAAIPIFLGLTCTLHVEDNPVIVTTFEAHNMVPVLASLLLPLLPLRGSSTSGCVAFYSGMSGAFHDLAEDARWIFGLAGAPVLDGHLPAANLDPAGIRGLAELGLFNQAIGVLVEEGKTPEDAQAELRRRAGRRGQTVTEAARQLLGNLSRPDNDSQS